MKNPLFVVTENIPLAIHLDEDRDDDNDYDDCKTPSRVVG